MQTSQLTKLEFKLFQSLCKIDNENVTLPLELHTRPQKILLNILVSGGQDSMCLLHALNVVLNNKNFKPQSQFTAIVTHFNHKKRGQESDEDAFFVMENCLNLGIEFFYFEVPENTTNSNFQNFARDERRRMSLELCHKLNASECFDHFFALTAHHARDHVESVLLHMIRGSGVVGLQGFYSENTPHFLKLFAEISKVEIEEYAKMKEIGFRTDSSNLSDNYDRNFLRHHILPQFEKINVNYEKNILRCSKQLKELSDIVQIPKENNSFVFSPSTKTTELYLYLKGTLPLEVTPPRGLPPRGPRGSHQNDFSENSVRNILHEVEIFRKSMDSNKTIPLKNNKKLTLSRALGSKNQVLGTLCYN